MSDNTAVVTVICGIAAAITVWVVADFLFEAWMHKNGFEKVEVERKPEVLLRWRKRQ